MRKVSKIISLLLVAILIVSCLSACGGGSYKTVLDNYCKAYENKDVKLMSSVFAQYYTEYMGEGWGYDGIEEFLEEYMEEDIEDWDCGESFKISYKIKEERRATKDELVDLEDNIFDWYATYSFEREDFSITDAYVVDVYFTVRGNGNMEQFYSPDGVLIIKENGKWRMARGTVACSFFDNNY